AGEDYGGLFVTLAGAGVLPGDFADELRRMAGFRNILVHGYLQTDPRLVRGLLVQRVDDLVCFGDLAMRALERVP
ncbi:MAG: DUF86 domain-containing protein, partial [Deltaproteobacteria bacterium]|nr:DUF86 domain-containing protein [Deltaproteobacteria bacterium]